eukprot:15475777-Alexandrium_andersonii.AAC.2
MGGLRGRLRDSWHGLEGGAEQARAEAHGAPAKPRSCWCKAALWGVVILALGFVEQAVDVRGVRDAPLVGGQVVPQRCMPQDPR